MNRLEPFTDPDLFCATALPFWRARPVATNLQWALAESCAKKGRFTCAFIVYQGDEIHLVGLRTDDERPLVLEAAGPLGKTDVRLIEEYCGDFPGLVANKQLGSDYLFSSRYSPLHTLFLIGYQLDELIPGYARKTGELVPASSVPFELIVEWLASFLCFIDMIGSGDNYSEQARKLVDSGNLYVYLLDGIPVSMAGSTRSNGGVAAVNYVFTPEHLRMNGYAYSCVGELSALLLKTHDCCILYADKDFPASNRVYQKLGYYAIAESLEAAF